MGKKALLLLAAALLILMAGCGGTSKTEDPERTNPTPPDIASLRFNVEDIAALGLQVTYPSEWNYTRTSKDATWIAAKYGDTLEGDMGFRIFITPNEVKPDLELYGKVQISPYADMDHFEILEAGMSEVDGKEAFRQIFTWLARDKKENPLAQCYAHQYYIWSEGYNYIITIFASGRATYDANLELIEHLVGKIKLTGAPAVTESTE